MLAIIRSDSFVLATSICDMNRLSPVISRRLAAFHFNRVGVYVSGKNKRSKMRINPDQINVTHSTQRQLTADDWAMNPPKTGPEFD